MCRFGGDTLNDVETPAAPTWWSVVAVITALGRGHSSAKPRFAKSNLAINIAA